MRRLRICTVKTIIPILTASALFVGCVKGEIIHTSYDSFINGEITFQLAPIVKADSSTFALTNLFEVGAFYLEPGLQWCTSSPDSQVYFPATTVSYSDGRWSSYDTYEWPQDGGRLTIFGWSLNSDYLSFHPGSSASVLIDREKGVCLNSFDMSLEDNTEFMVALANPSGTSPVTTHFRHQLSKLRISACTGADYSASKEIQLTSLCLKNVVKEADYQQGEFAGGLWNEVHRWTARSTYDAVYGDYSLSPVSLSDRQQVLQGRQYLYVPQNFVPDQEILEVRYVISDIESGFTEYVTENLSLSSLIPGGAFRNGEVHDICLTLSLDQITWDPDIVEWEG